MYGQHTATATGMTGLAYTGMQVGWQLRWIEKRRRVNRRQG